MAEVSIRASDMDKTREGKGTQQGDESEHNKGDNGADIPEVSGKGSDENQQFGVQGHMIRVPHGNHPDRGPESHVSRCVMVQPLLAEHRRKGREKKSGEA